MPTYAIGDVHGCSRTLRRLLEELPFDRTADRLWLVGDLVGHGPDSAGVVRLVRDLDAELRGRLVVLLGNHDLRLIAARDGVRVPGEARRLCRDLEAARGGPSDLDWLSERPLLHRDGELVLVHAGVLPWWTIAEASERASEARALLSSRRRAELLGAVYSRKRRGGGAPAAELRRAIETLRVMTSIRTLTRDGRLCDHKGSPETAPAGCRAWFAYPEREQTHRGATVVFGHWASLGHRVADYWIALDSGCVWGGPLSAVRLEDRRLFQVSRLD